MKFFKNFFKRKKNNIKNKDDYKHTLILGSVGSGRVSSIYLLEDLKKDGDKNERR